MKIINYILVFLMLAMFVGCKPKVKHTLKGNRIFSSEDISYDTDQDQILDESQDYEFQEDESLLTTSELSSLEFESHEKSSFLTELDKTYLDDSDTKECSAVEPPKKEITYNLTGCGDFNKSAQVLLDCSAYNLFADASFIYWQHSQATGMYLGSTRNVENNDVSWLQRYEFFNKEFAPKFEPGFKIGIGGVFEADKWDVFGEYTFYRAEEKLRYTNSTQNFSILLFVIDWQSGINDIQAKHKLSLDKVTFELGRSAWYGKRLSLRPFIGSNLFFTSQKYIYAYFTADENRNIIIANCIMKSNTWALGARGGLSSTFVLGRGFDFGGKFAFSLLFERNRYKLNAMRDLNTTLQRVIEGYVHYTVPLAVEADLGFSWNKYFYNNRVHYSVALKYEFQRYEDFDYLSTIGSGTADSGSGAYMTNPDTLYLHGPTLSMKFDF